jgi:hypothetical protein
MIIDRIPALERLGAWQGWLIAAFVISLLGYMVTRWPALLVVCVLFAVGAVFARAAWRRMEEPF